MSKNILVICSSLRSRSNSEALADSFLAGGRDAGHQVEKVTLKGKSLSFCRGCMACMKTNRCVIRDDAPEIVEKMGKADMIVFATPIYYFELSGQLKTLLDRANPLFTSDYSFRQVYLLTTAAEEGEAVPQRAISGMQGWIDCFENAELAGTVFAGGVSDMGEIQGHPALEEAYKMGRAI